MTLPHCPTCTCCGPADPVALELERVRQWCADNAVPVVLGDCIRQSDAARYLGRTTKTLQNWGDDMLDLRRVVGRVYVEVTALAEFSCKNPQR